MAAIRSKSLTDKITEAAEHAKESDLVHKLTSDPAIREQAAKALHSMQHKAEDIQKSQKKISKKAEKKLKKAKKQQAAATATVVEKVEQAKPAAKKAKKKRHPVRKLLLVATVGAVVALVVSEDARKILLDTLFGAEEEFEYTSTTASAATSSNGTA